jgi:hypothetical protein
MKQRAWGSSPGGSRPAGDFGAGRTTMSLFARASSAAQAHVKGPPMIRIRKMESWQPPQACRRVDRPRMAT